ncbi:hypothetical protein C5B42_04280 [Candidatus Cerribacteria bacterium 'Amazon FNV 2010 28 9']|uniref:Uncharacterized protein n=1 Tax=Candidatus Cerribacteria bacterium 'Amazon FNV 2010 28 9' TaxID=2081795 RepID=A0A317JPA0_9BACT|nr:MAG: hypothetical protein C5B42_04280 [Candidatus Cerribacteria bacterium 'Amazon FNV 2010 28 9']
MGTQNTITNLEVVPPVVNTVVGIENAQTMSAAVEKVGPVGFSASVEFVSAEVANAAASVAGAMGLAVLYKPANQVGPHWSPNNEVVVRGEFDLVFGWLEAHCPTTPEVK